jgi:hypothetical protein
MAGLDIDDSGNGDAVYTLIDPATLWLHVVFHRGSLVWSRVPPTAQERQGSVARTCCLGMRNVMRAVRKPSCASFRHRQRESDDCVDFARRFRERHVLTLAYLASVRLQAMPACSDRLHTLSFINLTCCAICMCAYISSFGGHGQSRWGSDHNLTSQMHIGKQASRHCITSFQVSIIPRAE